MEPTVGRIVHYISHGSPVLPDGSQKYKPETRAAIITEVHGKQPASAQVMVSLAVLNPTGLFFDTAVPYSEDGRPGSWTWPPRV